MYMYIDQKEYGSKYMYFYIMCHDFHKKNKLLFETFFFDTCLGLIHHSYALTLTRWYLSIKNWVSYFRVGFCSVLCIVLIYRNILFLIFSTLLLKIWWIWQCDLFYNLLLYFTFLCISLIAILKIVLWNVQYL